MLIYRQNLLEHLHQYISNFKNKKYSINSMFDISDYIGDIDDIDEIDEIDWY